MALTGSALGVAEVAVEMSPETVWHPKRGGAVINLEEILAKARAARQAQHQRSPGDGR